MLAGDAKDVLVSGCGASEIGAELSDRHAHRVVCVDARVSGVPAAAARPRRDRDPAIFRCRALVAHMQHRYGAKDRLEYREADCRDLRAFDGCAYDLVLDKALFDCVLCGSQNLSGVALMTAEAFRVLKPGGAYVVVSHGAPQTRLGYLERPALDWRVSIVPVQKPRIAAEPQRADDVYYVYVCRKAARAPSEASLY